MEHQLSYRNEDDKCYGATGMAVAVIVFDGDDMLAAVDLDAEPGSMLEFTEDFYFSGHPSLSAKAAWNRILKNFNITMALSMANLMCRRMVLDREQALDPDLRSQLRSLMIEVGHDSCSLDDDETSRLFDKNFTYLHRVFSHIGVQGVTRDFAEALKRRRRMTRMDVIEQLRALRML